MEFVREDGFAKGVILKEAKVKDYGERTMFRMPDSGKYSGFIFYLPDEYLSEREDGDIACEIPDEYQITLKNKDEKRHPEKDEWCEIFSNVSRVDYHRNVDREPRTGEGIIDIELRKSDVIGETEKAWKVKYSDGVFFAAKKLTSYKDNRYTLHIPEKFEIKIFSDSGDLTMTPREFKEKMNEGKGGK